MKKIQSQTFDALIEVLCVSTKLGLTSFGGPIAHLGYFYDEYVRKRKWMDDKSFADLVALCQFLPGPASSQVGIGIGIMRAGILGGILAFTGFTLPSALMLVLFAFFMQEFNVGETGWIHGLKIVAVAVIAHAISGMGQKLIPDKKRASIAILAAATAVLWQTAISQVCMIIAAGLLGYRLFKSDALAIHSNLQIPISRIFALCSIGIFFGLLFLLPFVREVSSSQWLAVFDSFYRAGSLVFGGGHVVLPLLERELVPAGWITKEEFLAGYGAVQAVPGPLFTFSSYLGAIMGGWFGAILATIAIFLPSFLLVAGIMPFWGAIRMNASAQGALAGINAAVVGILLAALYDPIWTSSIQTPADFALALALFGMLAFWKLPPWVIVVSGALGGALISLPLSYF